jgi:hypothetical protein
MKKIFFFSSLFWINNALSQNIATAIYPSVIPTSFNVYNDFCNGSTAVLSVTLPMGESYTVTNVEVSYKMLAQAGAWMSQQRSKIKFENNAVEEASEAIGVGDNAGSMIYSPRNIAIANGTYPGGTVLKFQLKARRTWEGTPGCNATYSYVQAGTFIVNVSYSNVVTIPKVGINTATPKSTLEVNGRIKLNDEVIAPVSGTIRWNELNKDFEGYNGQSWVSFTKSNNAEAWGNSQSQIATENNRIIANDGASNNYFGNAVAISNDYVVVGARFDDIASNTDQGSAYVFKKIGTNWVQQSKLIASNGAAGDWFGHSVAISSNYIVVGASHHDYAGNANQGAAYIFKLVNNNWVQDQYFSGSGSLANDEFGTSVSIKNNAMVITAPYNDVGANIDQGRAYVYLNNGTSWGYEATLQASDGASGDGFGSSVSLSTDTLIIGSIFTNIGGTMKGAAYIYTKSGTWSQQAKIIASDGVTADRFGWSVSINGSYCVVGTPIKQSSIGAVYVYKIESGVWQQKAKLLASDGEANDYFGVSVGMSDNYIVVGASGKNSNSGLAYLYKRVGEAWTQALKLSTTTSSTSDIFGVAVGIESNKIIVSAYGELVGLNSGQGAAYIFEK